MHTAFVLEPNQGLLVHSTSAKALCRNDHEGVTYITTTDLGVYVSIPTLDLRTGKTEEVWLNRTQYEEFRRPMSNSLPLNPRIFELPKIGIKKPSNPPLDGYRDPYTMLGIIQDKGGHWWHGDMKSFTVRPYYVEDKSVPYRGPLLRFVMPWLQYIGNDTEHWWCRRWNNNEEKARITICTREVMKVISKLGVWGYYVPTGRARIDVTLARKEAERVRDNQVGSILEQLEVAKAKILAVSSDLEKSIGDSAKLQEQVASLTEKTEAAAAEKTTLLERIEQLRARCEELEEQLQNNNPFWSCV